MLSKTRPSDACGHAAYARRKLGDLAETLQEDARQFTEPRAQALFETAAEVLLALQKSFAHYEEGHEDAQRH